MRMFPEHRSASGTRGPRGLVARGVLSGTRGSRSASGAHGLLGLRGLVARTEAGTPGGRDRAVDGLRALAILGVVVGHFMVMALAVHPDGALRVTSPLIHLPGLAPASWVLQMLGLFFLVGGFSGAKSLERAYARGQSYGSWLRDRVLRLA